MTGRCGALTRVARIDGSARPELFLAAFVGVTYLLLLLEPMGAYERRTVHTYLRDRTEVQTHSEGDEPDRRLVVTPVQGAEEG